MKVVNGRFTFDFDDFERRISPQTKTFILCNPQNPTGNVWTPEELTRIGEICLRHGVIVLADEIHCDWVTKGQKYTPFASAAEQGDRQQQPHLQGGEQVVRPRGDEVRVVLQHQQGSVRGHQGQQPPRPDDARHDREQGGVLRRRGVAEPVRRLRQRQPRSGAVVHQGQHPDDQDLRQGRRAPTWCGSTSARSPRRSARRRRRRRRPRPARRTSPEQIVERWFIKNAGVALNPGHTYGPGGANHMRMNIALSRRTLQAALTSMQNALKSPALSTAAL